MISLLTMDETNIDQAVPFIPVNYMRESLDENNLLFYPIASNEVTIGCIIAEDSGEELVLRYMEISEDLRGKGIGYEALGKLLSRAKALDYSRVMCRYIPKLDSGFDRIITDLSFTKYNLPFGFHRAALHPIKALLKNHKSGHECKSIRSLTRMEHGIFTKAVTGELGYGITMPISGEAYDLDISCAIISEDHCLAFILVENENTGEHYIRYLYNHGKDLKYLFHLFQFAVCNGVEKYGEDAIITAISSSEEICSSIVTMEHVGVDPMVEAVIEL